MCRVAPQSTMTNSVRDIIDGLLEDAQAALAAGTTTKALAIYQGVLAYDPEDVLALRQAGAIMLHNGNPAPALQLFQQALRLKPSDPDLYHGLGTAMRLTGHRDEAILTLHGALRIDPTHKPALYDLGLMYREKGDYAQSEKFMQRAAAYANAHGESRFEAELQRAVALFKQDRLPEAERWFHRAGLLNPNDPRPFINVAMIYRTWGHLAAAEKWLRQAIAVSPESAEAHWNLANLLLVKGELTEGFAEYEWRFRRPGRGAREVAIARWAGEPLAGKTILLLAEQGLGDVIHFSRFVPDFAARGARVVLEVHPGLETLLATVPGISEIITLGSALPAADFYCPMMSAAHVLGITLETIPAPIPYVSVPSSAKAPKLLGEGLRVGIVWRGNPKHENDQFRSVPLSTLEPILRVQGATFYSLQVGQGLDEIERLPPEIQIRDLRAELTDFATTAAVIAQLDVIITVDTAVAHLAGALGKTVFVLIARGNDWRWMHGRADSPWYPSLRLYRQVPHREWGGPVRQIATELTKRVAHTKR